MTQNNGTIGFEDKLWKAADKLWNNINVAEYKQQIETLQKTRDLLLPKLMSGKIRVFLRLEND